MPTSASEAALNLNNPSIVREMCCVQRVYCISLRAAGLELVTQMENEGRNDLGPAIVDFATRLERAREELIFLRNRLRELQGE